MAITAWAAKVSSSSICCGVNGPGSGLRSVTEPMAVLFAQQRCGEGGAEAVGGGEPVGRRELDRIERRNVGQVAGSAIEDGPAPERFPGSSGRLDT